MPRIKLTDSTCVEVSTFKDKDGGLHLNLRKFYKTRNSEDWMPAKQGITIPIEKGVKVRKAIREVLDDPKEFIIDFGKKSKTDKPKSKKRSKGDDE